MLSSEFFFPHVYQLIIRSACVLPESVIAELESGYAGESEPLARTNMETALHHQRASKDRMIPLCADTGFPEPYTGKSISYV